VNTHTFGGAVGLERADRTMEWRLVINWRDGSSGELYCRLNDGKNENEEMNERNEKVFLYAI